MLMAFQRAVRRHLEQLVGVDNLLTPLVSSEQANEWGAGCDRGDDEGGHCCTLSNFRFDIQGTPHSPWNQSAAQVFCEDFRKLHKLPEAAIADIMNCFYTRVKTLKAEYVRRMKEPEEQLEIARKTRRYRRKCTVRSGSN